jgi:hypothetical protein
LQDSVPASFPPFTLGKIKKMAGRQNETERPFDLFVFCRMQGVSKF